MARSNPPGPGFDGPKSTGHSTEKSEQPTKYTKHAKNEPLTKPEGRESNIAGHKNLRNLRKSSSASLRRGRTALDQPRPVGFQVQYHAVNPAHLSPSHLAQIPQHLVMDQPFPKLHDLNVALCRPPELPLGQGRRGLLPRCVHVQLYETLDARSLLNATVPLSLGLTRGAGVAGTYQCAVSEVGGQAAGSIH
jgi:hypothetical protein